MARGTYSLQDLLRSYSKILARKMGFVAVGWVAVYFISQPFRGGDNRELNILMLFAPLIGAIAGLVAGWYLATDAEQDSSLTGLPLWIVLVVASVLPMWTVDGLLNTLLRWPMGMGGFMALTFASLLALAAAVWHSVNQQ